MPDNTAVVDYRVHLLEQLSKTTDAFCAACRAAKDHRKPVGGTEPAGWSVHQLAQHVRDVDARAYGLRVRRTLAEEHPSFPKFDANTWAVDHYDADEPLEKILVEFENSVHELVEQLKTQPLDAWSRLGRHDIQGDRTLQIWVERSLEHIREHLEMVKAVTSNE